MTVLTANRLLDRAIRHANRHRLQPALSVQTRRRAGEIIAQMLERFIGVAVCLSIIQVAAGLDQAPSKTRSATRNLLVLMRNGVSYTNVHTSNPANATHNQGPGDFPGGEIRGQVTKSL